MNRTSGSKKVISTLGIIFAVGLLTNINIGKATDASDCSEDLSVSSVAVNSLPNNHSNHQTCMLKTQETISWFDWIGGKSPSYQFHFLDLLELLYGGDSSTQPISTGTGGSV